MDGIEVAEDAYLLAIANPKEAKLVGIGAIFGIFIFVGFQIFRPKKESGIRGSVILSLLLFNQSSENKTKEIEVEQYGK